MKEKIIQAAKETSVENFLNLIFPPEWSPITARILESGVEFDSGMCKWAPRWSKIPFTIKNGRSELEAAVKSCLFRAHDCLHQLWGLPIPSEEFNDDDFFLFKRAQMCGEVAVLTITEFFLAKYLYDNCGEAQEFIERRCAIDMLRGPFANKSMMDIAMRMDDVLHKKNRPRWMRLHRKSELFADYYVPMLEADREGIDINWSCMKSNKWIPHDAPNSRYSDNLDGLELTLWMISDFLHLLNTDSKIDRALTEFNRERRRKIVLPDGWG